MKKTLLAFLLIVCIVSCKKDNKSDKSKSVTLTDQEIISSSKAFYEASVLTIAKSNKLNEFSTSQATTNGTPGTPNWSKALVQRGKSGINITNVPYNSGTGAALRFNSHGRRNLLLYSDNSEVKQGYWIERDSSSTDKDSFTGNILIYDLNNNFLSGEKYEAGKLKSIIKFDNANNSDKISQSNSIAGSGKKVLNSLSSNSARKLAAADSRLSFYKLSGGGMICIDWYVRGCVPADNTCSEWRYDGSNCSLIPEPGAGPGTLPTGGSTPGGGGGDGGGGGSGHTSPPGTGGGGGAISADPYTEGGSVGYGPDPYNEDIPDIMPDASDFYVCPSNFAFVSVTTHDLWQESVVTDLYCHLIYKGNLPEQNKALTVEIPEIHFGLPYYNVEGKLVYSAKSSAELSADALNTGEFNMRQKFKENPDLTKDKLAQIWINEAKQEMLRLSLGRGRLGRTGSVNAIKLTPARIPYTPCN